MRRLLVAEWESPANPLRLCSDLTPADLADATIFQNTRRFIAALAEAGGTAATATGNLNRVFVRQMFDRLILSRRFRESTLRFSKVLNEPDVWPLHIVRVVSELAGLVTHRKKRFQVTRAGRELLPEAQAGALFHKLFLTYFRKFDLQYDFHLRAVPGIQQTLAAILWRLDNVAGDWTPVHGLAGHILLPGVLDQLRSTMVSEHESEEWILGGYVLKPLVEFGLLERRPPTEWTVFEKEHEIRLSPLWERFIRIERWEGAGR